MRAVDHKPKGNSTEINTSFGLHVHVALLLLCQLTEYGGTIAQASTIATL